MKLAAITGSIGCGKTTLAGLARELGCVVFDVDQWSRELYSRPAYINKVAGVFPDVTENGKINKKKLRNLVFDNQEQLKKLEAVAHPFLKRRLVEAIRKNGKYDGIFVLDAALLFEAGWDKYCDLIIVADVNYETQKQRVMKRDGISAADFDKINNIQMSNAEKAALADVVIDTDKPLNLLKTELLCIIDELADA